MCLFSPNFPKSDQLEREVSTPPRNSRGADERVMKDYALLPGLKSLHPLAHSKEAY